MTDKLYNVGMYIRLSRENTAYTGEDSMSIENQQAILSKFISIMPGWVEMRIYIDNGASGGNFNRQGFQDMMTDVRNGVINLVLVQDLSRFGRNYLESGKYLEEELPSLGCRFVALADGIDTETGENDIMVFLNAMNDNYLKNLSDKIKAVFHAKAKDGQKLTGTAPYGYMRNPDDHTRLIVDEYAAGVVKRIFEMRSDGLGYGRIVKALNSEEIPPPRLYYYLRQNREPSKTCSRQWQLHAIPTMLRDEHYLGNTVSFKYSRSYRSGKSKSRDKDDWLKTLDTHEAIIDSSLWETVQKVNAELCKWVENARKPRPSLFSGKIVCEDCKVSMMPHSDKKSRDSDERRNSYSCKSYHRTGRTECSRHAISEVPLKKIVLDDIRRQAELISLDEDGMLQRLREKLTAGYVSERTDSLTERRDLKQELHSLGLRIEQLYGDKVSGIITAEIFTEMIGKTEIRRQEVENRLTILEQTETEVKTKVGDIQRWVRMIKEKSAALDVDRDLLEALVDRIEVGESKTENGEKIRDVWIYYKFVGRV